MNNYSIHTDCIVLLGSKHICMEGQRNDAKRVKDEASSKEGFTQHGEMEMPFPSENLGSYCAGICSQSQEATSSAIRMSEDGRPEPGSTHQLCPWPLSTSLLAQGSLHKMTLV